MESGDRMNFLSQGYAGFRTNSIFIRIFFAVTGLVLGAVLVVAYVSYRNATSLVISEAKSNNILVLEQAQQTIDADIESIRFISLQTVMDRNMNRALYLTRTASYLQPEVYRDGMSYLNTIESNHEFIEDLWVYFNKSKIVLTSEGKYDSEFFFSSLCRPYLGIVWEKEFSQSGFRLIGRVGVQNREPVILFMESLPIDMESPRGTLVIALGESLFRERMGETPDGKIIANYVVDSQGRILYTNDRMYSDTEEYGLFRQVLHSSIPQFQEKQGIIDITCERMPFTVQYVKSKAMDWIYLSIMPTSYIFEEAGSIRNITMLIAAIGIFLSVVLAWIIVSRLYHPVSKILNYISIISNGKLDPQHQDSKNELVFINKIIYYVYEENKTLQDSMMKSRPLLKEKYLNDIINGAVISGDYQALGRDIGIDFPFPYFQVIVFDMDEDISDSMRKYRNIKQFLPKMEHIAQKAMGESCKCYFFLKENHTIISVMNTKLQFYEFGGLNEYLNELCRYLGSDCDTVFTIGVGKCYENIENCFQSFIDALQAVKYKVVKGQNTVIHIDEVQGVTMDLYEYPIETEMQLMTAVKSGDKELARQILEEIFKRNFQEKLLPPEMVGNLFGALTGTAIRTVYDMRFTIEEILGKGTDVYATLSSRNRIEEKKAYIIQIFSSVSEAANDRKRSQHAYVFEKIRSFIEENYSQEISLDRVAQVVNLSTPYLSFIFKEVSGKNFVDYVNEFRVEKAKQLLISTPLKISDVSEAVGYSNANVFSKVFKKYVGVSPGQFRKI